MGRIYVKNKKRIVVARIYIKEEKNKNKNKNTNVNTNTKKKTVKIKKVGIEDLGKFNNKKVLDILCVNEEFIFMNNFLKTGSTNINIGYPKGCIKKINLMKTILFFCKSSYIYYPDNYINSIKK